MTRQSIREYARAIRDRYWQNSKKGKTKILDEFTKTTRLHRKAAIRLLNKETAKRRNKKRGQSRQYNHAAEVLKTAWEAEDRICSKRLQPFLNGLMKILKKNNDIKVTPVVEKQLRQTSPATIDRLLRPFRQQGKRHRFSTTRPGRLLKNAIPIRAFLGLAR